MPTLKRGQKQIQVVLEEGSDIHLTLLEWAKKRGLSPGKAARVILADWSDAINGRPNPFTAMFVAAAGQPVMPSGASSAPVTELSAEEQTRQAALLQAAEQFM
jgi:hypothetical protein